MKNEKVFKIATIIAEVQHIDSFLRGLNEMAKIMAENGKNLTINCTLAAFDRRELPTPRPPVNFQPPAKTLSADEAYKRIEKNFLRQHLPQPTGPLPQGVTWCTIDDEMTLMVIHYPTKAYNERREKLLKEYALLNAMKNAKG